MNTPTGRRNKPRLRSALAAAFAVALLAVTVGPAAAETTTLTTPGKTVTITAPVKVKPPVTAMKVSW